MRNEYDFTSMKGRKNPYAMKLKKQITIRLDADVVEYFKNLAVREDIPYQNLINLYLKDCMKQQRKLKMEWS
jgi:uncharacterized protein (DUF4415 family)